MAESGERYFITKDDWIGLGSLLNRISDRLDRQEGLRGTPTFYDGTFNFPEEVINENSIFQINNTTNEATFVTTEAAGITTEGDGSVITGERTFENGVLFSIKDVNGVIIHQYNLDEIPYFNEFNGYQWGDDGDELTDVDQDLRPGDSPVFEDLTLNGGLIVGGLLTSEGGRVVNTTLIDDGDSPYTVLATDHMIYCDTDGGAIEINLPVGVEGAEYEYINCGSSGNDLDVDPNGAETILGGTAGTAATFTDGEGGLIKFNATEGWR